MTRYYAPASTGNFSVGFDLLGLALEPVSGELLGDVLEIVGESQAFSLTQSGRYLHQLPADSEQNLVHICFKAFEQKVARARCRLWPYIYRKICQWVAALDQVPVQLRWHAMPSMNTSSAH